MNSDDIARYSVTERLKDQRAITIRAIKPSDKALIIEALHELSADSIYFRLFASKREFTEEDIKEITEVDYWKVVALVAVLRQGGRDRIVAEGRYIRSTEAGDGQKAEVAFLVDDAYHGLGIASLLLKHLISIALKTGVTHLEAEVLRTNQAMLAILARSGFPVTTTVTRDFVYAIMDLRTGMEKVSTLPLENSSGRPQVHPKRR